jgi:flagellar biosynthesis protein FliR
MTDILVGDFVIVLFIFLRIISMIVSAPVLSDAAIPTLAKIFFALVLAYISFLTIDKSKIIVDLNLISIAINGTKEVITGFIMGFTLNFVFYGISYAGTLIGWDMGLMFAEVLNPMDETSNNIVGEVIFYVAMLVFLMINGHHYIISAIVASFKVIPLTKFTVSEPLVQLIVRYSFSVFTIAIKIASPIIVAFFLVHLAEGIISRVIPNIQIFFISQPVKIGLGFAFLAALAPIYVFVLKSLLQSYEDKLMEIIKVMSV